LFSEVFSIWILTQPLTTINNNNNTKIFPV